MQNTTTYQPLAIVQIIQCYKFQLRLKGSLNVETAFPIHVQAWGKIPIAILIASLPFKN